MTNDIFVRIILFSVVIIIFCFGWSNSSLSIDMAPYQKLDLIIKFGGAIIALISAFVAYFKYIDERNRQYLEKRLTHIYGPLIGLLTSCATLEGMNHTEENGKIKLIVPANWGNIKGLGEFHYSSTELDKILDGEAFLSKIEDHIGYARPQLVELFYQYKFFLQIKTIVSDSDITQEEREQVKLKLLDEIAEGYQDTIKKLGLE
ncbi:hypothetical protein SPSIL_008910 [Sporomusa silvacetica DSM 10669]|uniref:Uncharacterized protein n=1 Tax=Sporomusa silvacetica DSM 10669 TaxID=1123289 RepID=A0ABZ3IH18_9FIRM|nr:hypothetical protein [Sporomusa silvacetica]OZC13149.1 hypothetical protein SPSIL_56050 [Sporomusa silvacetica DSM 10669]